jgi:phosphate transport system substrate-binding protein
MKRSLTGIIAAVALASTVALVGPAAMAKETIKASGASYPNAILQACKTHFSGADLVYTSTGSGTGRSQFKSGATNFGMSDAPYKAGDAPAKMTYVPLIGGPIAIVYNVPGLTKVNLTGKIVGDIYLGKITKWNDAAIAAINKGAKLPAEKIQAVYRQDSSGTSENFTSYLTQVAGTGWKAASTFNTISGVVGTAANQNTGVTTAVKNTKYSLAYADLSDAMSQGLQTAWLKNGANQFIKPDVRSSKTFLAQQIVNKQGIVRFQYTAPIKNGYNLSLVSYALAPAGRNGAADKLVAGYLTDFIKSCAPAEAAKIGYVAIDGQLKSTALNLIELIG